MLGANEDFTEEQLALIPKPPEQGDSGNAPEGEKKDESAPAPSSAASEAAPPAEAAPAPAPAPSAAPAGDVRAALRASRRAEQNLREQTKRLQAENEELRKRLPAPPVTVDGLSSEDLEEIKQAAQENPLIEKLLTAAVKPAAPVAAPAPAQSDFQPDALPPETQEAVDDVPELLAWQNDAAQHHLWAAAKLADAYLESLPAWADKPLAQRFEEVVKRVKADAGITTSNPASSRAAQETLAMQAPALAPTTLSDMPGGGGAQPEPSRLARYQQMTQEQIFDDLSRGV